MRYIPYSPQHLQELRKTFGMSQRELAEELGVSIVTVQKWEQGKNEPSLDVLGQIGKLFTKKAAKDSGISTDRYDDWIKENKILFVANW